MIVVAGTMMMAQGAVIRGKVTDDAGEPLIGATVRIENGTTTTITDIDGNYELPGLRNGRCTVVAEYVFYQTGKQEVNLDRMATVDFALRPESQQLGEVVVSREVKRNTEGSIVGLQRNSLLVLSGVSAQQISRTQDSNASEVIKRIPGISIIDDKFVMVRGLSQRYNNVWVNRSAVPSSEADSRAFSFDIIPSSQLDNMIIVKSPAPEYPADFTGGFVLINTKDVPDRNSGKISLSANVNDATHFTSFYHGKGSGTDFLGFDNGLRSLKGGINAPLKPIAGEGTVDLLGNGLNNDWRVRKTTPIADLGLTAELSRRFTADDGRSLALLASANYSNSRRAYNDMENSLFGAYDTRNDRSVYLRHSTDNQYNIYAKLGAMLNLTYISASGNNRLELKNIFNQLGRDRYTTRVGVNSQSDNFESAEYYYLSRSTYNGQLTGRHTLGADERKLDWSAGYAYANNYMPDRRRYTVSDVYEPGVMCLARLNDIEREFTQLDEHIASGNVNYTDRYAINNSKITLRAGAYSEYRSRSYYTRSFIYNRNPEGCTLPDDFQYLNIPDELLVDGNYGADKLYMLETVRWTNNYRGKNLLAAGYASANVAWRGLNVYAGVRFEHNRMELIRNSRDSERSEYSTYYPGNDFFPSVNVSYDLTAQHKLRASYGRSINRAEFREVAPSVFYDFDLASNVQGNYDLKSAYIDNVDLSYEFYPEPGELVSLSLFYKNFKNPIEWTYTVNGGTDLTYSYINALGADNYGVELDVKKSLGFIGMPNFSVNANCALIHSKVRFAPGAKEKDRAMQGQSPYIVNVGVFYRSNPLSLNASVLYNRIGKRIVGVGRSMGSTENTVNIPDSYEMPRNSLDVNVSKEIGHFEVKLSARNILNENVLYKQFLDTDHGMVEEVTRRYRPGRNFTITAGYKF
ncbi:MAG: TonB-dependent receptor domain-containing protein [Muribaculaceae bacterium]